MPPRTLAPLLAALLIGACENDGGGAYPPSPDTVSSAPDSAPSPPEDAGPPSALALVAPEMALDPLVRRIHATGREEEPVLLDAIDWP